jgi:hypothetical protein
MRIAQWLFAVVLLALVMTAAREPAGRVCLTVFVTGLGEVVFGLASIMALFQAFAAIGEADTLGAHVEAVATTTVVLALATAVMAGWLFVGVWVVTVVV